MTYTKMLDNSWKYVEIGKKCTKCILELKKLNRKDKTVCYDVLEDIRDILSKFTINAFLDLDPIEALRIDNTGLCIIDYQRIFLEQPEYLNHYNYRSFKDYFDKIHYVKSTLDDILDNKQNILDFVIDDLIKFFEKASVVNMVGEKIVEKAVRKGFIEPSGIVWIAGIPHAQLIKMR